jgi:hypothetical protein
MRTILSCQALALAALLSVLVWPILDELCFSRTHPPSGSIAMSRDRASPPVAPLASRVVLYMVDGLSLGTLMHGMTGEGGNINAPFARSVLLDKGSFGLVQVRAPTESVPGHLATLGGFFEEPQSVLLSERHAHETLFDTAAQSWSFWGANRVVYRQTVTPAQERSNARQATIHEFTDMFAVRRYQISIVLCLYSSLMIDWLQVRHAPYCFEPDVSVGQMLDIFLNEVRFSDIACRAA